jgi:prepilin-type N-terminal cleavage/methylation domain-containing protein
MRSRDPLRRAFTLIELLVVIGILAFLAALTALFFPRFQERQQVENGANNLSGWLLMAKQMARRDGIPTGLRFTVSNNACTQLQYIQQPDDFAYGQYTGRAGGNAHIAQFDTDPQPQSQQALQRALSLVQPGDYLEIYGGGPPRYITAVNANAKRLTIRTGSLGSVPLPGVVTAPGPGAPTNYRIIPQPRPIQGEQTLSLPTDVIIDTGRLHGSTVLASKMPPGNEILFAPSGAVIGSGAAKPGYFYCYVRDNGQDTQRKINAGKVFEGNPRLVVIYPRTGFIATHPVNPDVNNHDLYLKDGRSSGM